MRINSEDLAQARASGAPWVTKSTHPRKFGNHVTLHQSPPTVRPHHRYTFCKISQSTGMATPWQLEVILAGNRIATWVTTKE